MARRQDVLDHDVVVGGAADRGRAAAAGIAPDRDGRIAWNILVARFDTPAAWLAAGAIAVCGAAFGGGAAGPPGGLRVAALEVARRRRCGAWRIAGGAPACAGRIHRLPGRSRRDAAAAAAARSGSVAVRAAGGPGCGGRAQADPAACDTDAGAIGHRRGLRRAPRHSLVPPDLESQLRPVGIADVDGSGRRGCRPPALAGR